jgi:hypothetical protein
VVVIAPLQFDVAASLQTQVKLETSAGKEAIESVVDSLF